MARLDDAPIPLRLQLSGLWASLTLCYLYGDYFGLYRPGTLARMLAGQGPVGPATQGSLIGVALLLLVPCLMVAACLVLPSRAVRGACLIFGILYTLVMVPTLPGAWRFYQIYAAFEMALTLFIAWRAWRWPKPEAP